MNWIKKRWNNFWAARRYRRACAVWKLQTPALPPITDTNMIYFGEAVRSHSKRRPRRKDFGLT